MGHSPRWRFAHPKEPSVQVNTPDPVETTKSADVETVQLLLLDDAQLQQVVGGAGPNDNWKCSAGPHDNW